MARLPKTLSEISSIAQANPGVSDPGKHLGSDGDQQIGEQRSTSTHSNAGPTGSRVAVLRLLVDRQRGVPTPEGEDRTLIVRR